MIENGDHDRFVVDRVHEDVVAVPLMIEGVELHFADPARQLRGGGKRARRERGNNGHVQHFHVAEL